MAGKLITLPLRVWFHSARFLTRATFDVAGRAVSLAGQTIGATSPDRSANGRHADWQQSSPPTAEPSPQEAGEATPQPPQQRPQPTPVHSVSTVRPPRPEPVESPAVYEAPAVQEPVHVSEEPELVRESAEPGAEDGAGAAVTVLEPWNGYQHMNAREVIARARQATRAELAAVRLYEARHRSRQTVLAAVDRQLKLGNGADPA